ncbi:EAL and HDOD domain-containing protein [Paraburkholderia kururiensis]|uniref:EAL domain-containing protein n=1 Tax=Paraburkholderia kururiensis TaxID=984307 RepID=A0ABZ0WJA7_9BURK|nr:EAL domain-containing protein [Paraburkholderia kururiensis]WQD77441.1 EAL domain-containing protein [Paraburkholderia kururiensis]
MSLECEKPADSFLARQPIVDAQCRVVGYELLFRSGFEDHAVIVDGVASTLSVLATSMTGLGLEETVAGKDSFLNCTEEVLRSPYLRLLPPRRFVLEVLESCAHTAQLVSVCARLRRNGFRIALDDVRAPLPEAAPILAQVDIVKLDWPFIEPADRASLCRTLRVAGKTVLAEKVETWEDFCAARDAGASLFQGYFFCKPETLRARNVSPSAAPVLRVIELVLANAQHSRVAMAVADTPPLLAQLLRLASAAATVPQAARDAVDSIEAALTIVGIDVLIHWCALLLYLNRLRPEDDPLAQLAAQRGAVMASYISHRHPEDEGLARQARLTGSLSLLHVAYDSEAAAFWQTFPIHARIRAAIVGDEGILGRALAFARSVESEAI